MGWRFVYPRKETKTSKDPECATSALALLPLWSLVSSSLINSKYFYPEILRFHSSHILDLELSCYPLNWARKLYFSQNNFSCASLSLSTIYLSDSFHYTFIDCTFLFVTIGPLFLYTEIHLVNTRRIHQKRLWFLLSWKSLGERIRKPLCLVCFSCRHPAKPEILDDHNFS